MITKKFAALVLVAIQIVFMSSCSDDQTVDEQIEEVVEAENVNFEIPDWTSATHSKKADPNFAEVFDDNSVKRLDIVITKARWKSMLADMTTTYGTFGSKANSNNLVSSNEDPLMVPAEVFYKGKEWYRVGVRFKGNSSLQSTWSSGNLKLSFKLDFDEYEDTYPQIDNQRFYGFKKLSLKNNYNDKSMLREKVATDIFRASGVTSSHAAFYELYVDHGDGPTYFGVYTLVEEVDDTLIDEFSNNDGNLYKPDGTGASFASGTFTQDVFVKKTNEDAADYTDIQSLFTALHASNRTTDAAAWRTNLESVFDTNTFLKYLAVNTVIQNWDTYGRMTHNYYLYNNPDTKKIFWIPWDNNEALQLGNQGGSYALNFSGLNATSWPLIGYLYNDPTYKAKYDVYVKSVIDNAFNETTMKAKYTAYGALVKPYAIKEVKGYTFLNSTSDFQTAIDALSSHVTARTAAANAYLK